MKLELTVNGIQEHEVDVEDSTILNDNSLQYHNINTRNVQGWYRISKHEQFRVFILELHSTKKCELEITTSSDQVEMTFLLEGKINYNFQTLAGPVEIEAQAHNIVHSVAGSRKVGLMNESTKWMIITFPVQTFLEYVPGIPEFRDFRSQIMVQQSMFLYHEFEPLNINMTQLIHEIEHCSSDFPFKCLLIKIKVLELLWNQVDLPKPLDHNESGMSESEYIKIAQVKSIIEENYIDPPALSDLARQVGSNEFYLKKGFKAITGTTVFGYIHELKMKKAIELLKEQDWNIQQVAEAVGYKYAQHFSTAFKKTFGVSPGRFKQKFLY